MLVENKFKETIKSNINDAEVYFLDPMNDGMHYKAYVISDTFKNMNLVKQQQSVMNFFKEDLSNNIIHAISLKTFTHADWNNSLEKKELQN